MLNFSALWKFFFDFSSKYSDLNQSILSLTRGAASCDSLHDSLVTAYLLSGRAVDPRHGPHQPAEAGGVPDERGEGQGQEALRAQVSP